MSWCKQGSTQIQALFKYLWYGAGLVPWWSQGSSTLIRGTGMFLLAVWDLVPNVIVPVVLCDHKCCIHVSSTWIQALLYKSDTTMVRTANEKQVVVCITSGTDKDSHGRIRKTHSRSEYNSTSEELIDETREGLAIVITERHEKSIGYVSPSIQIPPKVPRAHVIVTASRKYNRRSRLMWNWYYGGCFN